MSNSISDYGIIGNLQSVALVGRNGAIDWLCLPHIDSPSVFAALLDRERGGSFSITPEGEWDSTLSYLDDSNVLTARFRTRSGSCTLTDFLTLAEPKGKDGLRDFVLLRLIKVDSGQIRLRVNFAPRFDYGRVVPELRLHPGRGVVAHSGDTTVALSCTGELSVNGGDAHGVWDLHQGDRAVLRLHFGAREPDPISEGRAEHLLVETLSFWREWLHSSGTGFFNELGPHRVPVIRSLLVLKLLCFEPQGTMAAAATTSLPEDIGGVRNWDYRYSWVRDTAMALTALFEVGHFDEVQSYLGWLEEVILKSRKNVLQVMYRMDGTGKLDEYELPHLKGYRGSAPVRIGNKAAQQKQFSIYGHVLIAAHLVLSRNRDSAGEMWQGLRLMCDFARDHWREADWSIWEIRGEPKHYVHSKSMCWVTLDRGLRIARHLGLPPGEGWEAARTEIENEVQARGWSATRQAFTMWYDSDTLDGSALLMSISDFIPYDDPRMLATVEALRMDLAEDGFLYRYRADDGLPGRDGTFLACTLWLITNLAKQGEIEEADLLLGRVDQVGGHLHLLAEEYDPIWQEQLGNFPQAFSHEAYIVAATALANAKADERRRPEPPQLFLPEAPHGKAAATPEELAHLLAEVARDHAEDGHPDYGRLARAGMRKRLAEVLASLAAFDLDTLQDIPERTSYWCNLHALVVIHAVLALQPRVSVKEIPKFYRKAGCRVGREEYSAEAILHGILRGNRPAPGWLLPPLPPGDPRLHRSIRPSDPRILFAVHTATASSPPITVLTPGNLEEEVSAAVRRYLGREARLDLKGRKLVLPRIFKWFDDPGRTAHDVAVFVAGYTDADTAREIREHPESFQLEYAEYDWRLAAPRRR
ncbi:glycoside hydrolase family 15 protein [Geomonas agri]|uniref:glycoside hydrolase family 15 protein n=1 Tax=Geomonas agri TaxID=2873702 RepID=UPI001CD5609C|nr:glycoside hydrolase family 15 protein [Geomonas agri]